MCSQCDKLLVRYVTLCVCVCVFYHIRHLSVDSPHFKRDQLSGLLASPPESTSVSILRNHKFSKTSQTSVHCEESFILQSTRVRVGTGDIQYDDQPGPHITAPTVPLQSCGLHPARWRGLAPPAGSWAKALKS